MGDERKYRQRGYMDRGDDKPKGPKELPQFKKSETFGPRAIQMPGTRTVSRCAQCGAVINLLGEMPADCSKCGFPLHSCKQCVHFDPASRFECRQPIPERVARKDARNTCTFYALKTSVEKETSAAGMRADDARKAFDNLFKK